MKLRGWMFRVGILAMLLAGRCALAQRAINAAADPEPGSQIHVYLLTFGPGDDPWEKFGHNAIRIVIDSSGDDFVSHWGAFEFGSGFSGHWHFIWNFIQGKLLYHMAVDPGTGRQTVDYYAQLLHRDVQQQELNLTPLQKSALIRTLFRTYNDPKLRNYRYDYYLDNCSTRVRDAIDQVVDHRLKAATQGVPTGTSFRFHTDRLDTESPWLYVALQGVMGHLVDRPIDQWEEMFLPDKVHDRVNELTVERDGRQVKLVMSDQTLYKSPRPPEPARPPRMMPWLLAVGALLGGLYAALGHLARRSRAARWSFVIVTLPWLVLMGVGGSLIWWGWLATDHLVARNNENVLHVSVLALPLLVMLPRLAFGKPRGAATAQRFIFAMVAISVLGMLLKTLPWFYQVNWPIISLCLPVNAALAYAAWVMAKSPTVAAVTDKKKQERARQKVS